MTTSESSRSVVVTGGASGIGAAAVERFLTEGAQVTVLDRTRPAERPDHDVRWIEVDLSSPASIDAAADQIGPIDVLCNVAGLSGTGGVRLTVAVNFLAVRHLTAALAPRIRADGAVVTVASTAGWRWRNALPAVGEWLRTTSFEDGLEWAEANVDGGYQAYERSKQAVVVWTSAASQQYLGRFRVNCVSPGPVETPLLEEFYDSMGHAELDPLTARGGGRNGDPAEIAEVLYFLSTSAGSWINGTDVVVDGGAEMAEFLAAQGVLNVVRGER